MIYQVVLTARAERDRNAAFAWYAEHYSVEFAIRWYDGIQQAVTSLGQNPLRCSIAHENVKFSFDVHELLFGARRYKHRILFTIQEELVIVLHIRHSAQRDLTADDL